MSPLPWDYDWTGYSGTSIGYPLTVLEANDGTSAIQVTLMSATENEPLPLEDAEVQAIINSIVAGE